jgi:succinyl-CoA synthetase alpha subunit
MPPLSRVTPALRRAAMRRNMSTTAPRRNANYESTRKNLILNSNTRVMMQGFTGKQATANAIQSIDWGTKIVGGGLLHQVPHPEPSL